MPDRDYLKYERIINKLKKSFPELKDIKINLKIKELKKSSVWAKRTFFGKYIVIIDPLKYKDANNTQIIGALAHEFVHFAEYKKWNIFRMLLDHILYNFKEYKMNREKGIDRETIKRGFAKQLYSNREFRIKNSSGEYKKRIMIFYLSPEEIRSYAKKIGKWD